MIGAIAAEALRLVVIEEEEAEGPVEAATEEQPGTVAPVG
jgi:hypothetical protein